MKLVVLCLFWIVLVLFVGINVLRWDSETQAVVFSLTTAAWLGGVVSDRIIDFWNDRDR